MAGYISEGIRYFRVAKAHCDLVNDDSQNAFVSIIFAAMYIESVVNEVIFTDQLTTKMYEDAIGKKMEVIDLDIYNERKSFENKVHLILGRFGVSDFENDIEFIELCHLMTLRGFLVHLKPVKQTPGGEPERQICRAALNYLYKNKKLIGDPFGKGVFWTDVLMKREVADWALFISISSIEWLFHKTHDGALGNHTLSWHRLLTTGKVGV